jgi:hypothetical protein
VYLSPRLETAKEPRTIAVFLWNAAQLPGRVYDAGSERVHSHGGYVCRDDSVFHVYSFPAECQSLKKFPKKTEKVLPVQDLF